MNAQEFKEAQKEANELAFLLVELKKKGSCYIREA